MRRVLVRYPHRRMSRPEHRFNGGTRMPLDIAVEDEALLVTADIPGVSAENVEVKYEDGVLHLKANLNSEISESTVVRERPVGSIGRSIRIPETIVAEGIEAWVENGVLNVRLPKAEEALPKRIEVQAR